MNISTPSHGIYCYYRSTYLFYGYGINKYLVHSSALYLIKNSTLSNYYYSFEDGTYDINAKHNTFFNLKIWEF